LQAYGLFSTGGCYDATDVSLWKGTSHPSLGASLFLAGVLYKFDEFATLASDPWWNISQTDRMKDKRDKPARQPDWTLDFVLERRPAEGRNHRSKPARVAN